MQTEDIELSARTLLSGTAKIRLSSTRCEQRLFTPAAVNRHGQDPLLPRGAPQAPPPPCASSSPVGAFSEPVLVGALGRAAARLFLGALQAADALGHRLGPGTDYPRLPEISSSAGTKRSEGDVGRCGEMRGDVGRCARANAPSVRGPVECTPWSVHLARRGRSSSTAWRCTTPTRTGAPRSRRDRAEIATRSRRDRDEMHDTDADARLAQRTAPALRRSLTQWRTFLRPFSDPSRTPLGPFSDPSQTPPDRRLSREELRELLPLEAEDGFLYPPYLPHISPYLDARSGRRVLVPQLAPERHGLRCLHTHSAVSTVLLSVVFTRCSDDSCTVPSPRPHVGVFST